jgi:hypothetical protein
MQGLRRGQRELQRQGGFSHRRLGGDDDQVGVLEATGDGIQPMKPGMYPGQVTRIGMLCLADGGV